MRKFHVLFHICLIGTIFFSSCSEKKEKSEPVITIKDDLGREIKVKSHPARIMALTPSITETLFLICPDSMIVGRTQNCKFPQPALAKPVVNNYPIDFEKLYSLKPDLIFAKEGIISLEDAAKIQAMGIPMYFQRFVKLEDMTRGISEIGELTGHTARAKQVVDSLNAELIKVKSNNKKGNTPKVLVIISLGQIFVFGKDNYISDMLEAAGGKNAMEEILTNPFPQINSEYVMKMNPDIIILTEGNDTNLSERYPEWRNIPAVKNNDIYIMPGDLVSRPGPRIVDGIKYLQNIINK